MNDKNNRESLESYYKFNSIDECDNTDQHFAKTTPSVFIDVNDGENINNETKVYNPQSIALQRFRKAARRIISANRIGRFMEQRLTAQQIFKRYTENSTLHGFRYIFYGATSTPRRLIWTFATLTLAGLFMKEFSGMIDLYIQRPFSTTSILEYVKEQSFPAITICNTNEFKKSVIERHYLDSIFHTNNQMFTLNETSIEPIIAERFSKGERLASVLSMASHDIEHSFVECIYRQIHEDSPHDHSPLECGVHNATTIYSPTGSKCFTFNSGPKKGHDLMVTKNSGVMHGFKLTLHLETNEYPQSMPYQEAAFKVYLHEQIDDPFISSPFYAAPGFLSLIDMRAREMFNLEAPFKTNCRKSNSNSKPYRKSHCYLNSLKTEIEKKCKCKGLFMRESTLMYCNLTQYFQCYRPLALSFKLVNENECPLDCHKIDYSHILSYGRFLANPIRTHPNVTLSRNVDYSKMPSDLSERRNYIRENYVQMLFYFGEMSIEKIFQESSYDIYKFLGDVGGQLGLMLGASVLTVAEFVDLFLYIFYNQFIQLVRRRHKNKPLGLDQGAFKAIAASHK